MATVPPTAIFRTHYFIDANDPDKAAPVAWFSLLEGMGNPEPVADQRLINRRARAVREYNVRQAESVGRSLRIMTGDLVVLIP